jgi:hypothetical protein
MSTKREEKSLNNGTLLTMINGYGKLLLRNVVGTAYRTIEVPKKAGRRQ